MWLTSAVDGGPRRQLPGRCCWPGTGRSCAVETVVRQNTTRKMLAPKLCHLFHVHLAHYWLLISNLCLQPMADVLFRFCAESKTDYTPSKQPKSDDLHPRNDDQQNKLADKTGMQQCSDISSTRNSRLPLEVCFFDFLFEIALAKLDLTYLISVGFQCCCFLSLNEQ